MNVRRRITGNQLRVGGRYMHHTGSFVRQIEAIEGSIVFWRDELSSGQCNKQTFLKQCPSEAPESASGVDQGPINSKPVAAGQFTIRDEANAVTAFAFRNGFLEELHAGKPLPAAQRSGFSRISDDEMRQLMIEASGKLAQLLKMKHEDPQNYEAFIRMYKKTYCRSWVRD